MVEELTKQETESLKMLIRYGSAEDCRCGRAEVESFATLESKGLVHRRNGETYITQAGRKAYLGEGT